MLNAGQQAMYSPTEGTYVDVGSLIAGDVSAGSWYHQQNALWQCFGQNADGYYDAHELNRLSGTGRSFHWFTPPPGCTSVTLSVTASEATSKAIRLALINVSVVEITGSNCALTTVAQTFSQTVTGLVAGTTYGVSLETNNTGQLAVPLISSVRAVPNGTLTGTFAASFTRLGVEPSWFGGTNTGCSWESALGGQFLKHNTFADVSFWTDAARFVVESWGNTGGGTSCNIATLVNGNGYGIGALVPGPGAAYDDFVLPPSSSGQIITVRGGVWQSAAPTGNFLRAIYLPSTSQFQLQQSVANQRCIVFGDSIGLGGTTTAPHFQCWTAHLKRRYPGQVMVDCYNGRQLFTDGNTAALRAAFVLKMAQNQPVDVWMALGVNDYINATWTAAAFGTGYAATVDAIHAVCPGTRVWCQSPINKTTEGVNGVGSTLPNYRTQIQTIATDPTRVPWCNFVDGTGSRFPLVADLADGIHPNTLGHLKYGDAVLSVLAAGGVL